MSRTKWKKPGPLQITAKKPTVEQRVSAVWEAEFSIIAEASPNPSATLDSPDATTDKGAAGQMGSKQPDTGKPPIPRFTLSAYNGGPMKLTGWKFPVIVDGKGVKAASPTLPIYLGHITPSTTIEGRMAQLMGQTDMFSADPVTGKIAACGNITGSSELCAQAVAHAAKGFKWQASIDGQPNQIEFIPEGSTTLVNGRLVAGPCVVARSTTLGNIAVVEMGADTSTIANLAAEAAKESTVMEFSAWLKATYAMDAASLTAESRTKFEAEFNKVGTVTAESPKVDGIPSVDEIQSRIQARRVAEAAEDERIAAVRKAAAEFPEIAAQAVRDGWSVDKAELEVLRAARKADQAKTTTVAGIVAAASMPKDGLGGYRDLSPRRGGRYQNSGGRISDDLCRVIEAGALISAGYSPERLATSGQYGERAVDLAERMMPRGMGPMGLARMAARYAGVQLSDDKEDAYRTITAEFSTLSLPTILSNLMNKLLLESYSAVDPDHADPAGGVAWQKFVKRGPVQDFKPHYRVRLTSDMRFQSLGQGGEIKHGELSEQSYKIQVDTKAIMFGLTRKDIINDDLSAMSSIPQHFGVGAGETIAQAIYTCLCANQQSDGATAFFTASAVTTKMAKMIANLLTSAGLSVTTLSAAWAQFMNQTKPNGQPLGVTPKTLLVPPGLCTLAKQIYQSTELIPAVVATSGTEAGRAKNNILAGMFKPVCSSYLATTTPDAGAATTNWYLMTGANDVVYPIEAAFLNGQEMPIVERDEMSFDRLGIAFRGFVDFGVAMGEQRAAVRNQA